MDEVSFYIQIRQRIVNVLTGVRDAPYGSWWDDSSPNSSARRMLGQLYSWFVLNVRRIEFIWYSGIWTVEVGRTNPITYKNFLMELDFGENQLDTNGLT